MRSRDTETQLSGLPLGNASDGTVKLRGWLAKQSREGRSRTVLLDSVKAKLAELTMDNL